MHTPGPWTLPPTGLQDCVYDSTGQNAVCATEWRDDHQEQYANARLIAAAPTMLNALDRIGNGQFDGTVSSVDQVACMREVARKAIESAEQPIRTEAQQANARLIAQSPNMLDLLTESLMYVEECEEFHDKASRTLSKRIRAAIEAINPTK